MGELATAPELRTRAAPRSDFPIVNRLALHELSVDCSRSQGAVLALGRAVTVLMPELTARGLVLWRLRRSSDQQLWCSVHESSGELKLTVHEPSADRTLVSEVHLTIAPLVERAEHLQERLVSAGWQLVDVDLDEPD